MEGGTRMSRAIIALTAVGALTAAATLVWTGQGALLYAPDTSDPGPAPEIGGVSSDVDLTTNDGLTLRAWRFDPATPATRAVLYLPGNGGNRAGRATVAQAFTERGFTTLLIDYRGFGGNPGTPREAGLLADARAAYDHLTAAGFDPESIYVVGESLGTAVAVALAAEVAVAGVLLRSPFTSMADVARGVTGFPVKWLLRDTYDTASRIDQVTAPVRILAGAADSLVPSHQSREIAERGPGLQHYVEVPGAGHNDELWFGGFLADQLTELAGR